MALPVFDNPLDAQADGYDAIPLTFGGIVYVSEAGKEVLANGVTSSTASPATTTVAGVVKQAAFQAAPAALTAVAAVGSAPTKAEYDALLADVTALRTSLATLIANLKTATSVKPTA